MQITFRLEDNIRVEDRIAGGAHAGQSGRAASRATAGAENGIGAAFTRSAKALWGPGAKEKPKTMEELSQEAGAVDVQVMQNYMTVASNTMSDADYAKLSEDGFSFENMDPDEVVTILDKIKAELARSGQVIVGYTDDIDLGTLTAALGSETLARTVADSFVRADIPLTEDNLEQTARAWELAAQLQAPTEGVYEYLIDNQMEPEIRNFYLAQNSGAEGGAPGERAPQYYAEDIAGYYAESAEASAAEGAAKAPDGDGEALTEQIDRVTRQAHLPVGEESRRQAGWLLNHGLPLTPENMTRLSEMEKITFPVTEEAFAKAAAVAIAEGRQPVNGNLAQSETIYEKAVRIAGYFEALGDGTYAEEPSGAFAQAFAGQDEIIARRQLEEIRLHMTAEVNVKLIKSGFAIDTAPMEQLIEALKQAEEQLAREYFPNAEEPVADYRTYRETEAVLQEIPGLPAGVLGRIPEPDEVALRELHSEGAALRRELEQAGERYETLMTAPRRDLGDSIRKAFANVDDILKSLELEVNEENRRAVRILGYNRMEITQESVGEIRRADDLVQSVISRMTPAAVLKMIRDGVNPLEQTFPQLEEYFDSLPGEYGEEESYSRFLYRLEQREEISAEERDSYIGIFRLVRQIEKGDHAAIGALVNGQAELRFRNLLSAVRSGKWGGMDVRTTDGLGTLTEVVEKGIRISDQIESAFSQSRDERFREEADRQKQLLQQASEVSDASYELLESGQISPTVENLLAAQSLVEDSAAGYRAWRGRSGRRPFEAGEAAVRTETLSRARDGGELTAGQAAEAELRVPDPDETATGLLQDDAAERAVDEALARMEQMWERLTEPDFAERYHSAADALAEAVSEAVFSQDGYLDVRNLQSFHKQLSLAGALARSEEFFLPMMIGEELLGVHLTFERGERRGELSFSIPTADGGRMEAALECRNGRIRGILKGNNASEVTKWNQAADIFRDRIKEETDGAWTVEELSVSEAGTPARMSGRAGKAVQDVRQLKQETTRMSQAEAYKDIAPGNTDLYRIAKVFLQGINR